MDFDKIRRLVSLVEKEKLAELTVEEGDLSITIKAESAPAHAHAPAPTLVVEEIEFEEEIVEAEVEEELSGDLFEIRSPMIGIFYRSPSPDSPHFVEVGDMVEAGQTVGLIEAMKVFSEVPSEVSGRVVATPAANAKLVQQGDVLVVLDTSENPAGG
ncbi:MAG: acetyl-CoA carboxylase [Armatimonadota bacterium]